MHFRFKKLFEIDLSWGSAFVVEFGECLAIISTNIRNRFWPALVRNGGAHEIDAAYIYEAETFLSLAIDTKVNATAILCDIVRDCPSNLVFMSMFQLSRTIVFIQLV